MPVCAEVKRFLCAIMFSIEKCCFCVPRRLGFVIIGCLRVVILISALWLLISVMIGSGEHSSDTEPTHNRSVIKDVSIISSITVDMVMCGLLIMAAVKSHLKLYQVFYHYSIAVAFCTLIGVVAYIVTYDHNSAITIEMNRKVILFEAIVVSTVTIIWLLQLYIIFLTRSEIMKIKKTQFWDPRTGSNVLL